MKRSVMVAIVVIAAATSAPMAEAQESPEVAMDAAGAGSAVAEVLDVVTVVERVLESDPRVVSSTRSVGIARAGYDEILGAALPNIDLVLSPYAFDTRRIPGNDGPVEQTTHSASVGLSVLQPLVTSGSLVASVENELRLVEGASDAVEQVPEFVVALEQPLFVGGNVVDTEVFRAAQRSAEIGFEQAVLGDRVARNEAIDTALTLYVQVAALRRSVALLERTIDLLNRQIASALLDRDQGLISDNALLALQVARNDRRETLFDTELALLTVEQALSRAVDVPTVRGIALDERFLVSAVPVDQSSDELIRDNISRVIGQLSLELASQQALTNNLTDRPQLNISFRATPLYPDTREDPDDASTSFRDYFEDGSDWESSVELELTIPLLARPERRARETADELRRELALIELEDTERAVRNELATLLAERQFLVQRFEILETDIEFEQNRVSNEQTLLDAGLSTDLLLEEVTLDLVSRQNEAWEVEASLFLNGLEILSVAGRDLEDELL